MRVRMYTIRIAVWLFFTGPLDILYCRLKASAPTAWLNPDNLDQPR